MRFSYKVAGVIAVVLLLSVSFAAINDGSDGGIGDRDIMLDIDETGIGHIDIGQTIKSFVTPRTGVDESGHPTATLKITPSPENGSLEINSFTIKDSYNSGGWGFIGIYISDKVNMNKFEIINENNYCALALNCTIEIEGEDAELWIGDFNAKIAGNTDDDGPNLVVRKFDTVSLMAADEIYFTNISFSDIGELKIKSTLDVKEYKGGVVSALAADRSITMQKIGKAKMDVSSSSPYDISGMKVGNELAYREDAQKISIKDCDDFSMEVVGANVYGIVMLYHTQAEEPPAKTISITGSELFINLFGGSTTPIDAVYGVDKWPYPEKIVKPGKIVTDEDVYGYGSIKYSVASIDEESETVVMKEKSSFESGKTQRIEGPNLVISAKSPEPTPTPVPVPTPGESTDYTALAIMIGVLVVVVILSALAVVMVRKK